MKHTQKLLTQILIIVAIIAAIAVIMATVFTNTTNCLVTSDNYQSDNERDTLLNVQVIFRHGIRTLAPEDLYPNDPYNNYSFSPENFGELTNKGRQNSYLLGLNLRNRYNDFLGSSFYPGIVKSTTSGYDRTQMTLQCVLAALFPNNNSELPIPWRPIIFEQLDFEDDTILGFMEHCKPMIIPPSKPTENDTIKLFEFLTEKTGLKIESYYDVVWVTTAFEVELANGLDIPDWAKPHYPKPLRNIDQVAWREFVKYNYLFGTAGILKAITQNALETISNHNDYTYNHTNARIVLFSGHDYNLQFLLFILGIDDSSTFSAHFIFELHKINGIYGFKVFYNNFKVGKLVQLDIPFCKNGSKIKEFCPMDLFIWNTEWLYESDPKCPTP